MECTETYAQRGGQGRLVFDHREQAHGEVSPPLRDGTRILRTCLNEGPDQALILG